MSKITMIYDNNCSWEKDYIDVLFKNIVYNTIYVEKDELLNNLKKDNDLIILVFSSYIYTFQQIQNVAIRIKPIIIVNLSDEFGSKPEYTHLAAHTKLLLHQHHFNHYPYNNYNNIIQIPLGYMTNMFDDKYVFDIQLKPLVERKYKWSFIGNMKQDRAELVEKFSNKFNENFVGNNILPSNMFDVYNNSIFVPNGKGNYVIDCFRIYEAILSGSIPVIVCNVSEFMERFYYNNCIPPFIFEESWDKAVLRCEYLLNNMEELEIIQKKNYKWLKNKIESIQLLINEYL